MERIAFNIGKPRRETLQGREYLVAPATLIKGGAVLNGSRGPGLYPSDEVASDRNSAAWNRMPLVLWHPEGDDGSPITARCPEVINEYGVGDVYRVEGVNGDSKSEAWFDVAALKNADARFTGKKAGFPLLPKIERGEQVELSTGLFPDYDMTPGINAEGVSYDWIARNLRPDHVAILPDQRGACSTSDGCGVNNVDDKRSIWRKLGEMLGVVNESTLPAAASAASEWTNADVEQLLNARMCWGRPCDENDGSESSQVSEHLQKQRQDLTKIHSSLEQAASHAHLDEGRRALTAISSQLEGSKHPAAKIAMGHVDKARQALFDAKPGDDPKAVAATAGQHVDAARKHIFATNQENGMKTKFNRKQATQFLVANCDCFRGKKAEALNALPDDAVEQLQNSKQLELVVNNLKAGKLRPMVNADGEGEAVPGVPWVKLAALLGVETDPRQDPIAFAAGMKEKLTSIVTKLAGDVPPAPDDVPPMVDSADSDPIEPDEDDQTMTSNKRKITEDMLPPDVRQFVKNARQRERQEKAEIVNRLLQVQNVLPANRQRVGDAMFKLPTEDLRAMLPAENAAPKAEPKMDWSLAGGGPTRNADHDAADADIVDAMTRNEFGGEDE